MVFFTKILRRELFLKYPIFINHELPVLLSVNLHLFLKGLSSLEDYSIISHYKFLKELSGGSQEPVIKTIYISDRRTYTVFIKLSLKSSKIDFLLNFLKYKLSMISASDRESSLICVLPKKNKVVSYFFIYLKNLFSFSKNIEFGFDSKDAFVFLTFKLTKLSYKYNLFFIHCLFNFLKK
jgi:hypothetical protein